ncbi:hypothetical protein [Paenibacillus ihbetae]|nr:hypothetical protein [Paenibacillus ihbetae]
MTEHTNHYESSNEKNDNTDVQFRTVDDILEYYGKRHKGIQDAKESVN